MSEVINSYKSAPFIFSHFSLYLYEIREFLSVLSNIVSKQSMIQTIRNTLSPTHILCEGIAPPPAETQYYLH